MSLRDAAPVNDAGTAQSLFDEFGTFDTVETFISTNGVSATNPNGLDTDTQAALTAVLEAKRTAVSNQIAAAIAAFTPPGQAFPDIVASADGKLFTIDTASGAPRLDPTSIVNAIDIPLPGVTPPAPTPEPTPAPDPTPTPAPDPTPTPAPGS